MPIPEFIVELRRHVGTAPLWLIGTTAVVRREIDGRAHVLLVRRADSGDWAPVSGIVDPGEDPHVAAERETREEASVQARVRRLAWVSVTEPVVYDNGDRATYLDHTYLCDWVSGEPAVGDDESTDARFWPSTSCPTCPATSRPASPPPSPTAPRRASAPSPTRGRRRTRTGDSCARPPRHGWQS